MSTYVREKVLRIPFSKLSETFYKNNSDLVGERGIFDVYELLSKYPGKFKRGENEFFQIAPTEEDFLDYVLEKDASTCGEWGRNRPLYENEQNKYRDVFQKIDPDINMTDVRLVEYCWYDCTEAPNYYDDDPEKDSFYDEV